MKKHDILELILEEGNYHAFTYRGIDCEIKRNNIYCWCGYLLIESDFKDDINVSVHGGITFDDTKDGIRKIGFDCAHSGDRVPFYDIFDLHYSSNVYRDKEYVISEVKQMADQILEIPNFKQKRRRDILKEICDV